MSRMKLEGDAPAVEAGAGSVMGFDGFVNSLAECAKRAPSIMPYAAAQSVSSEPELAQAHHGWPSHRAWISDALKLWGAVRALDEHCSMIERHALSSCAIRRE